MGFSQSSRSLRPLHLLFLILALCALVTAEATPDSGSDSAKPTKTTAPIYLPHYDTDDWEALRGSIISKVRPPSLFVMKK